jgi:hypothetical protein
MVVYSNALAAEHLKISHSITAERDRLKKEQPRASKGGVRRASVVSVREPPSWYDDKADNPPWIKALAEVRRST